jgi:hypothetical protein
MSYEEKYIKYKNKYLKLKELSGGGADNFLTYEFKDGVLSIKQSYTDTITKQNIEDIIKNKIITTVEIDISFTKIDDYAFANMNIQKIIFKNEGDLKLTDIGNYAFINNKIVDLVLPSSIKNINKFAFANNKLKNISFSDTNQEININFGDNVFQNNNININEQTDYLKIFNYTFANNTFTKTEPETIE